MGLDPLRKQLLETALQGKERYEDVELETLRLFKDLHASDPLLRKMNFEQRGRGRGASSSFSSGSSGRGSYASSTFSRSSAATSAPLLDVFFLNDPAHGC